jgi:nucleotide-binding universal stress UspA family protein
MFKKILVPCDGSELVQRAVFPRVEALGKSMDAEIIVLRVIPVPSGRSATAFKPGLPEMPIPLPVTATDAETARHPIYKDQEIASAEEEARRSVTEAVALLRDRGLNARSEVILGRPADEIIDYAERENVDLIVMCSHGASGIRRWVFGSVTEKVLRGATTPVMLIRPEELRNDEVATKQNT